MSLQFGLKVRMSDDLKNLAQKFPAAGQAVLNRAAGKAEKLVVKQISTEYNVPAAVIDKRIILKKSTQQSLVAVLKFSQKGFNPYYFLKSQEPTTRREPVELEIKRGSTTFAGPKFFTNIGRKSGKLRVMQQPGEDRSKLALMKYLKASEIFDFTKINPMIEQFATEYMKKELPRVIKAFFKSGRAV